MTHSTTKEALESLKELKGIIELSVASEDGRQYAYLETRRKSFIFVTDALKRADAAIAKSEAPSNTRSTFSGAADYDQTTPFNGVVGASE